MVNTQISEGITEVLDILEHMDKKYLDKVPEGFMNFLYKNQSLTYKPNLDHSKELDEMELKEETRSLLGVMYYCYWCDKDAQKQYEKQLMENEKKYQEKLKEKYNPDNLFKCNDMSVEKREKVEVNELQMIKVEKPNIFKRLLDVIKMFFLGKKDK